MSETIKAEDLSRKHLGMIARVQHGTVQFTDLLGGVLHEADMIAEYGIFDEVPKFTTGRIATVLILANGGRVQVAGTTDVEITPA